MLDEYKEKQPIIYKILKNSLINNKISHAYLFDVSNCNYGMDFIKSFIKSILCNKHLTDNELCDHCSLCKTIDDNNYPDIIYINTCGLMIKKDLMSDLQVTFNTKSLLNNKKIYVINGAEYLNSSSANSILKFIEEPEDNIIAILLTNNINLVLKTIVSRCQVLTLLPDNSLKKYNDVVKKVASYLYNSKDDIDAFVSDQESLNYINDIIDYAMYYEHNKKSILLYSKSKWLNIFNDKQKNIFAFSVLELLYKDIISYKLGRKVDFFNDYINKLQIISELNDLEVLYKKLLIIIDTKDRIKYNVNMSLNLDNMIIEMENIK